MSDASRPHSAHRRDGGAHDSEAVEDYAKAIYALARREDGPVGNGALSERLGVSPGSVTAMLKRMDRMGLVELEPYRGVRLTGTGERIALEVIRHHRLIEAYLSEALGMSWDRVHDEAEVLEHYISEDLEELIASKLGDPSTDPHGDPIPDRELSMRDDPGRRLSELAAGEDAMISRVSDGDPRMLRFLADRGLRPGTRVSVATREPVGGAMTISAAGVEHVIGEELARRVLVA